MNTSTAETTPLLDLRSLAIITITSIIITCSVDISQSLLVWVLADNAPLSGALASSLSSAWCCCTPLFSIPIGVAYAKLATRRGHSSLGGGALGSAMAGGAAYAVMAGLDKLLNLWIYPALFPNALKGTLGLLILAQRKATVGLILNVALWSAIAAGAAALAGLCVAALDQQRRQREALRR